jgi:exopolyphosphatase/guanosine-5'-triphosphate,3'-diphosphate pyrophosphatase
MSAARDGRIRITADLPLSRARPILPTDASEGVADAGAPESEHDMIEGRDAARPLSAPGRATDGSERPHQPAEAAAAEPILLPGAAAGPDRGLADGPGGGRTGRFTDRRSARRWRERGPFYAALDLGTNNCRLLVAEPNGGGFRVVDSFSRIVRLGEGLAQNGALKDEAMERAIAALRICRGKLDGRPIARGRLIATEACRQAENGAAFLSRVRDEIGLDLEVIDRRTEARLAVEGCFSLLDAAAEGAVLFDIGGGSTEIVWLDRRKSRRRGGLMRAWVSLPVGVVTLAERHGGEEVDREAFEAMVDEVAREFERFRAREALRAAVRDRAFHFLGTSGTVTTLAGVHLDLPRYDRRYVDGLWMGEDDIERMMSKIRAMDYETRRNNPCIGRERADLVLAGCAIFEAIRREWPCSRLRVADRGLREGILVQLMRADGYLQSRGPAFRSQGNGAG